MSHDPKKEKLLWEKSKKYLGSYPNIKLGKVYTNQLNVGHLAFTLARYHFVGRILERKSKVSVLELGCGEGIGSASSLIHFAEKVLGVDFDEEAISYANENIKHNNLKFICDNFLDKRYGIFDAVISIDTIEHIDPNDEDKFLSTIRQNVNEDGFCIIGTPNLCANKYASPPSKVGHINLYDAERLESSMLKIFNNVFTFGMNDTVPHVGFKPMAHYLFALACNKK